jgi:transposase InsO family protein
VSELCDLLGVARSGYYAWVDRPESEGSKMNRVLEDLIDQMFKESRKTYGSPRITHGLRQHGYGCNHKRVERLMRAQGLKARARRRWRPCTTDSAHDHPIAENLLRERPAPVAINEVWVSDITYLPTNEGWLYLAGVMDLYSRRVIGWSIQESLETGLPLAALQMALGQRGPAGKVIHHSDRGCQYASERYRKELSDKGLIASMSRRGNCYDNAAMESFWSTLKTELRGQTEHLSKASVRRLVIEYIEVFYNRKRFHSSLDYQSPVDFENQLN